MKTKKIIVDLALSFFLALAILFFQSIFCANDTGTTGQYASAQSASSSYTWPETNLPDPSGGLKEIAENFLKWLLGIFGVLALISFIISGIQYLTAAGNDDGMKTAKRNMTYSILGVVVALSGFVIVQAVDAALRGTSTVF